MWIGPASGAGSIFERTRSRLPHAIRCLIAVQSKLSRTRRTLFAAALVGAALSTLPALAQEVTQTSTPTEGARPRKISWKRVASLDTPSGAGQLGDHAPHGRSLIDVPTLTPSMTDYAITGALAGGFALSMTVLPAPTRASFSGGLMFDDGVRRGLRIESELGRANASHVSDVLQYSLMLTPVLDGVLTSMFGARASGDTLGVLLDDAQAFLVTGIAMSALKSGLGRERPGGLEGDASGAQSFPSRHTAMAFTGAGLICSHHLADGQGDAADVALCGAGLATATATGLLRIAADRHYTTDVLAGAAIGLASGYFVPRLIDGLVAWATDGEGRSDHAARFAITPDVREGYTGLSLSFQ